jgi:NADP-dependent 3-hydroxy acid dehydrogenase YdfG
MSTPDGFSTRRTLQSNTTTPIAINNSSHGHDRTIGSPCIQEGNGLLKGKVAAITGGVTGIGRAITVEYLKQGASVAVNHLDDESSRKYYADLVSSVETELGVEASRRLISVPGDISKPETGQQLTNQTVQKFGKLDVFVSNAGVCEFTDFLEYDVQPRHCIVSNAS